MQSLCAYLACLVMFVSLVHAQSSGPVLCKYKTFTEVNLFVEPDANSTKLRRIPSGKTLQAIARKSYWVKVQVGGNKGWLATTAMERLRNCPQAPYLEMHSNGYKIIKGVYRNFFGIYNSGTASYADKITVRVFGGDKLLYEKVVDLSDRPIVEDGGTSFFIDTEERANRFEFETKDRKQVGVIDRFIERIH